jgi:phosphogluconate dehydratase
MMMEMMGLHMPGSSFVLPGTKLRQELTRAAVHRAAQISWNGDDYRPLGHCVDEKAIVNAIVGLLATGGSTNHVIHLPAMARAAGVQIDWDDMDELSRVVPLIASVYPNGAGDVNYFHAAGGMPYVIRELLDNGLAHADIRTVYGASLAEGAQEPVMDGDTLTWNPAPVKSGDDSMLRPVTAPFQPEGGLRLLQGNLGRGTIKVSAVDPRAGRSRRRARLCRPERRAQGVQGGRTGTRRDRRGAVPGPGRQRHARTAQADPAARRAPGSRFPRRPGHRWAHVGRLGQSAGRHPRFA